MKNFGASEWFAVHNRTDADELACLIASPTLCRQVQMPAYRFSTRQGPADTEWLGAIVLPDDAEALAFGRQLIRDFKREHAMQSVGWTLEIAEQRRTVGIVAFDSIDANERRPGET